MVVKLSYLIEQLNKVKDTYGDMPVSGNILSDKMINIVGLCIEDNYEQGYTSEDSDERYSLSIELDNDFDTFSVHKYPHILQTLLENY